MKKDLKYLDFDLESFLESYAISYKDSGKNIGRNWIGIEECPFCGATGYHLGINKISKNFHCWVCTNKGSIKSFIRALKIPYKEIPTILEQFTTGEIKTPKTRVSGVKVIFPSNLKEVNQAGKNYIKARGFNPTKIIETFKLQQTGMISKLIFDEQEIDFRYRLFIPFFVNRKIVGYSARDFTGNREPRYIHSLVEASIIPPASCIYNIDNVSDRCLLLEGPTDVWRFGNDSISIQGVGTTNEQLRQLLELNLKKIVIMLDPGKENEARKLGQELSCFIPEVKIVNLNLKQKQDPANLKQEEAVKIKHELLYL